MDLYERIKEIARLKNISIAQIERANDLSNGSISKWAKNAPSADKLAKVARYLNVTSDYLLGIADQAKDLNGDNIVPMEDESTIFSFDGKPVTPEERDFLNSVIKAYRKQK
ncbi:helix-turn-helix domain-containing protein [Enterococcus sp. CSURQ0835]|uniref:helix-turn-helix domain-containing protein n=1 Tax=Enterococcus sp. CSURQ0835 TaxID=2681394 RepID=UPI0013586582|nr:helix-turn-helix transcriptional regulator [Enterococcus sp. CSURQ0835]